MLKLLEKQVDSKNGYLYGFFQLKEGDGCELRLVKVNFLMRSEINLEFFCDCFKIFVYPPIFIETIFIELLSSTEDLSRKAPNPSHNSLIHF